MMDYYKANLLQTHSGGDWMIISYHLFVGDSLDKAVEAVKQMAQRIVQPPNTTHVIVIGPGMTLRDCFTCTRSGKWLGHASVHTVGDGYDAAYLP